MDDFFITRRLSIVQDELDDELKGLYSREDFVKKLRKLTAAGGRSGRDSILADLFKMFDLNGIQYEKGKDDKYYIQLVKNLNLPDSKGIEQKIFRVLFAKYLEYPSPENYMERIVNRLAKSEDGWESDTLRLRILKQFIKYGNYLSAAGYSGKTYIEKYVQYKTGAAPAAEQVLEELDDQVFDCLETAKKPQVKPEGPYGLLKLSDDLAAGKFKTGGATKKGLYLFAMAFDMTYYYGPEDKIPFPEFDIEKNLFRDYYSNNLIRFLTEPYRESVNSFEIDPSGQGINYKNFAEIIYIYYIAKDMEPVMKIRRSAEMIAAVQGEQADKGKTEQPVEQDTRYYRDLFHSSGHSYAEDILNKSEDDLRTILTTNYDCSTQRSCGDKSYTVGPMQLETEQNSAYEEYKRLIEKLEEEGIELSDCSYGLWFTDPVLSGLKIADPDWENSDKYQDFILLLDRMNAFLGSGLKTRKQKVLKVPDAQSITRTSLIAVYYYYFNENNEDLRRQDFSKVFMTFKAKIDPILERAYYQPFSGKNLFDILIAFSSYTYLND